MILEELTARLDAESECLGELSQFLKQAGNAATVELRIIQNRTAIERVAHSMGCRSGEDLMQKAAHEPEFRASVLDHLPRESREAVLENLRARTEANLTRKRAPAIS